MRAYTYVTGNLDNLSDDNLFSPMTHTFAQLDYANATFQTPAVNERETVGPIFVNPQCMTQNAVDINKVQCEQRVVTVAIFVAGARSTETQSMCGVHVVLGGI